MSFKPSRKAIEDGVDLGRAAAIMMEKRDLSPEAIGVYSVNTFATVLGTEAIMKIVTEGYKKSEALDDMMEFGSAMFKEALTQAIHKVNMADPVEHHHDIRERVIRQNDGELPDSWIDLNPDWEDC